MIPLNSILAVAVLLFVSTPGPATTPTADSPTRSAQAPHALAGVSIHASLDHPVVEAGALVTQSVVAQNTGITPLLAVRVASDVAGSCVKVVPLLSAGDTVSLSCRGPASASGTATATVRGLDLFGGSHSAQAGDPLRVLHPGMAMTASASPAQDVPGEQVGFPVVLRNTGDAPLSGLALTGQGASCPAAPAALAAGASATVRCTSTAESSATARFTAAGHDELGAPVGGTASAAYTVLKPGLVLTVSAPPGPVAPGAAVPVTVGLRNTGQVELTDVRVSGNPAACDRTIASLAVGASTQYTCTVTVTERTTIALTATGLPEIGGVSVSTTLAVTDQGTLQLEPGQSPTTPPPALQGAPVPPSPPAGSSSTPPPPVQAIQAPPPPPGASTPGPAHPRLVPAAAKGPLKTAPAATAAVIGVLGVLVMTVSVGAFTAAGKPR
jgi:hypothetical protein